MKDSPKTKLPLAVSEFLQSRFPDGFQFDEIRTEKDDTGQPAYFISLSDGEMDYQFRFNAEGKLINQDISPVYPEETGAIDEEFHEDDH
jgi:hypothetical protein